MQKRQSKNLRKSINKTKKVWQDKSEKKEHSEEENCQEDLQQRNYLGGQIRGIIKNTGEG